MATKKNDLLYRKGQIVNRMKDGERFTARQINEICLFNDARKFLSDLRRHLLEYEVRDVRLANGCKLYWLVKRTTEPTLFERKEVIR